MQSEDVSDNPRIASLTRMMLAIERAHTADETIAAIRRGLSETYGHIAIITLSTRNLPAGQYRILNLDLAEGISDFKRPLINEDFPVQSGGLIAQFVSDRRPQIIHDIDWSVDPYFHHKLADHKSILAIPFEGDRTPLNWAIFLKRNGERFTPFDLEQLMLRVALIGSLLDSQALALDLARANQRIAHDISQIAQIQRSLLPDLPKIPGLELAASYEPSGSA